MPCIRNPQSPTGIDLSYLVYDDGDCPCTAEVSDPSLGGGRGGVRDSYEVQLRMFVGESAEEEEGFFGN